MVSNILDNAVKHGRSGGRIDVHLAARPAGGAVLTVADDGPGIPAKAHGAVLRRFHRLDAARATPGTGLGLALVKAVADLHGMALTLGDAGWAGTAGGEAGPGLRVTLEIPGVAA
ncbi:sensor histidine kinase [Dankookia sp. P2]|uniref:sensor histidine kinase n=1 Tax=Dankookia sp. P2 TaxID=3423955 RepID=UPI003D67148D